MDIFLIGFVLFFVVSVVILLLLLYKNRRFKELKEKTAFAAKADNLAKIEMSGNDLAADVAKNFNFLGEKLSKYRSSSNELSGIKQEKQGLDFKLKSFEDSISQLNLLTEIGRQITSSLNLNDIAQKLFKNINSSMMADEVYIFIEKDDRKNYFNLLNGKMEAIENTAWCEDKDNILNWSNSNNKEVFLNQASRDFGQYVFKPLTMVSGKAVESAIAIPLGISNKMMGAITVLSASKDSFSEFHLNFVRSLASYVAVAIDNANLYGELKEEKQKSENLLLNILPYEVAEELKNKGCYEARDYKLVSVLFTDFKNFTKISETLSPAKLVEEIDFYFSEFDRIIQLYGIEKIKTIGDAYMAAGGLPISNQTNAYDVVSAALHLQKFMKEHNAKKEAAGESYFEIRIGIHTGPLVAGIVGVKKFAYDIWGDTVNTASRMESSGEAGKVNISGATYNLIKDKFHCEYRGKITAKGKGELEMYFVE